MRLLKGIGILAVVIIILGFVFSKVQLKFGMGNGNGDGSGNNETFYEDTMSEPETNSGKYVEIRIDETKINVNDEECSDIDELKDTINKLEAKGEVTGYNFEHEYAIKQTYDEVKKVLKDLEEELDITVNYNEQ